MSVQQPTPEEQNSAKAALRAALAMIVLAITGAIAIIIGAGFIWGIEWSLFVGGVVATLWALVIANLEV